MKRLWQRFQDWRKVNVYAKRGLDAGEVFYRLARWQRALLVILCAAAYVICVQPTFSANVAPHFVRIIDADGHFNVGELVETLKLSAFVLLLTVSTILFKVAPGISSKLGVAVMSVFIGYTTLDNACFMQKQHREERNDAPRQKADRIARLDKEIESGEKAFGQVPPHDYVMAATVKSAETALEALKKSAYDECHTGVFGNTRGPKCDGLEKRRDAKAEEVEKLQHNADLTQRATDIEIALGSLKRERKELGAAPESVGTEMEPIPALMARLHIISPDAGQVLTEFKPTTDAVTMELTAWFAAPAAIIAIFKMFSFFTCHRGEADRRMVEMAKTVAEERAKVILAAVPQSAVEHIRIDVEEMEADHSPESVLEIEGAEPPAFARNPETIAEVMAAAVLKADPVKQQGRKARTKQKPHKDSVKLWVKERIIDRPGRDTPSDVARSDYEAFCWDRNLAPVPPQTFGTTLAKECGIEKVKSGGKTKYLNIGLRPALRVVSG